MAGCGIGHVPCLFFHVSGWACVSVGPQDSRARFQDIMASFLDSGSKWRCIPHLYIQSMCLQSFRWQDSVTRWLKCFLFFGYSLIIRSVSKKWRERMGKTRLQEGTCKPPWVGAPRRGGDLAGKRFSSAQPLQYDNYFCFPSASPRHNREMVCLCELTSSPGLHHSIYSSV